ncbi:MAG: AAA family ATPase [Actinomycetia bacterium]|nr:AAA family ATPase [Actinomycetes bacterium]MCP4227904.1 AAA family ATPase [Actinomycetes bacterium]MCP5032827.1 AAA family ATPase [Actinomycetes bacterium]
MTDQDVNEFTNFTFDDFGIDSELDEELNAAQESNQFGGTSLAIVDADQAVRDYLAGQFEGRIDTAGSLVEIETRLGLSPIVVILGPSCAEPDDLAVIDQWSRVHPHVGTVLITAEMSTELLKKALRVGVKDVLSAPIDQDQLIESVTRVADALAAGSVEYSVGSDTSSSSGDEEPGQVISVFSTKGGSGKSVTATNLGVVLAQRSDRPVVLIDGHLQFGDVAVMLKLQPQHTVVDAVTQLDAPDAVSVLEQFMMVHEPSGLLVLPAPVEPTFADQVSGEQMARLIELVRTFAGHVIIDLPAIFNELVLSIIEASDEIVLVAGLDIPNIKNVKIGLSTLSLLSVPTEKLHLVLNRADSKVKLDVGEVERTLRVAAVAHVPSDIVVPISVNKGSPVVLSASKSGVARAFEQLALRFLDNPSASSAPRQGRRKFFG